MRGYTAPVINLDSRQVIRVKDGPFLLGSLNSPMDIAASGIDLAEVVIEDEAA